MENKKQCNYLDNNATTQIDKRVVDAMMPIFTNAFRNTSSSLHASVVSAATAPVELDVPKASTLKNRDSKLSEL